MAAAHRATHAIAPVLVAASALGLAAASHAGVPLAVSLAVGALLCGTIVIALERLWPHDERWLASHGDVVADALHVVVTGLVVSSLPGLVAPDGVVDVWPMSWPLVAQVAVAIVAKDFCLYWSHRALHRYAWRVHQIHHAARRLYWLNAWRAHPFEGLVSATAATLPLALLGAGDDTVLYSWLCASVFAMVQHANIAIAPGPLDAVFATTPLHRWHHAPEGNANYGTMLIVWDRLFGTYHRGWPAPTQIGGPVVPSGYLAQLAAPLVRSAASSASRTS